MSCSWDKGTILYLSDVPGCLTAPLRLMLARYTRPGEKTLSVVVPGEIDAGQATGAGAAEPWTEARKTA